MPFDFTPQHVAASHPAFSQDALFQAEVSDFQSEFSLACKRWEASEEACEAPLALVSDEAAIDAWLTSQVVELPTLSLEPIKKSFVKQRVKRAYRRISRVARGFLSW